MRKLFSIMLVGTFLMSLLTLSASAAYSVSENFDVYINGGSVVSSKMAEKALNNRLPMWAWVKKQDGSTVKWLPSEYVNIRGRSPSNKYATSVEQVNSEYVGQIKLPYLDGYGQMGYFYRMAVQYDNNNPYTHLELTVSWSP